MMEGAKSTKNQADKTIEFHVAAKAMVLGIANA
jgi:hypothetical protein